MFPIRKWNNQSHKALPLVGRPIHVPQRLVEGRCTSVFNGSSSRDGGSKSGIRDEGSRELAEKCMGKIRMQRLPYVASSHDGGTESFSGELTKG
ncbi:hypothetical protein HZH68_002918 [Vespula germanica]|uniref:Uncharacterized protein n=1 Tax=Vespula germanica TaxID=30212 RepID=A0A834NNB2_VESGE|nr:hypothetical protein HZH68_002918 [Vespula germanica]